LKIREEKNIRLKKSKRLKEELNEGRDLVYVVAVRVELEPF